MGDGPQRQQVHEAVGPAPIIPIGTLQMIRYTILRMIIRRYSRKIDSRKYRGIRKWAERGVAKYVKLPEKCVITPADAGGVPAEWVSWQGADDGRVILFLHGGGYVFCSPVTHRDLVCRIACASAARALSIDYRLAPERPILRPWKTRWPRTGGSWTAAPILHALRSLAIPQAAGLHWRFSRHCATENSLCPPARYACLHGRT